MSTKRLIGVQYTTSDKGEDITRPYVRFAEQFGEVRLIMPLEYNASIDLLMLVDGPAMSASDRAFMSEGVPSIEHGRMSAYQKTFYDFTLDRYLEQKIPIFGIGIGAHQIASKYGSTLTSNIAGHDIEKLHPVVTLTEMLKKLELTEDVSYMSSKHNQAIKKLGPQLLPVCYSVASKKKYLESKEAAYECVEAFMHNILPIAAVQSRPEMVENMASSYTFKKYGKVYGDPVSLALIHYLLTNVKKLLTHEAV